jgi:hypothetical protein
MKIKIVLGYYRVLYDECYLSTGEFICSFMFTIFSSSRCFFDSKFIFNNTISEYAFITNGKTIFNKLYYKENFSKIQYYIL